MRTIGRVLRRLRPGRLPESPPRRGDEGFGMIESIVAMVVLLGVLIPTGYLFTNVLSQSASARQRITALSVAEQWIETLNTQGPPADTNNQPEVGTTISEPSSVLSGITYAVSVVFNWTDATGGTPDFCSSATSPVLGLQVTVSWVGGQSITDQAILNFPASGNLTNGYLAVQVNGDPAGSPPNDVFSNPWSTRVTTVPVQVSGATLTTPYSLTPSATGCTFLQLAPGTYTVQVGPGPSSSYVANYNEASSETQALSTQAPITVTAAEITEVVFQYDEGANVGLSYPTTTATDDGISCPNKAGVICLAMGQSPASTTAPSSSPVATGIVKTSSGWSVASFPSSMTRIEDVDCTTSVCIAVGYSSSGAAAAVSTNGISWSNSALPLGVAQLTSIVCPTGATTFACVAIGSSTSSNGVLLTATISGSTPVWTTDAIPSVTALTQILCPSTTLAQPICFVMGRTSSTAATIISNTGSSSPGTTWHAYTLSGVTTMSALTQMACNSTTHCVAIGTNQSGPTPGIISIYSVSGTTVTWKLYTASGFTPTAFTSVACAVSGSNCWATGTKSGPLPLMVYWYSGTTWKADSLPAAATTVGSVTCLGSGSGTGCFALDTTSSGAGVVTLNGASSTTWNAATVPPGVVSLTQLVCLGTSYLTAGCYAVGTGSSSAIIVALASGSWTGATFTGTTGGAPVYLSGIACTATTTCEAAGATETAAAVLDTTTGTSFSGSGTPSTLSGLYLANPPIMVSNSNLQPNATIEMSAPTTANGPQTQVGPLFPFASGYSIAVGYCASELTTASASASTVAGATPSTTPAAPTVILPMGILPIEATTASGAVLSGATITIADASCTSSAELTPQSSGSYPALSNPPANPSNPTSYSMPTTGVDGLSRIAVIYGTYLVTVTYQGTSATTTVTVNPTSIVVGTKTYYMPAFVPIPD